MDKIVIWNFLTNLSEKDRLSFLLINTVFETD